MPRQSRWSFILILAALAVTLLAAACSPKAPAATAAPAQAATLPQTEATVPPPPAPTETAVPATATPLPTVTATAAPTATETTAPTATQAALGLAQDGISGWCVPQDGMVSASDDPLKPPSYALMGKMVNGTMELQPMPFNGCVFMFTFNQAAPEGLKLELYELTNKAPFWKVDLKPAAGKPETVAGLVRHYQVLNPRVWDITYEMVVRDANGTELARSPFRLIRPQPYPCWQGNLPDPYDWYCPFQQDLHPWDIGYGKKLPTVTPRP